MASLFDQSIPVFIKYLNNLSHLLQKGQKFCEERGMNPDEMLNFRLIEDMRGLPYQVQSCSNTAKFAVERLSGVKQPFVEDDETTFDQLQERIKRTLELLQAADPKTIEGKHGDEVIMETKMGNFRFTGQSYVSDFAIPNFHFHLTTAYCIMRHLGVPLGAMDYLKDVFQKV